MKSMEMSVNKVEMKTIKKIPALLGEVDLVRADSVFARRYNSR
jgi:hypothetical protein